MWQCTCVTSTPEFRKLSFIFNFYFISRYSLDKNTKSKIVDVQPCVGYRFAVETNEKNTLGNKNLDLK